MPWFICNNAVVYMYAGVIGENCDGKVVFEVNRETSWIRARRIEVAPAA